MERTAINSQRSHPLLKWMPSLTDVVILLPLVLLIGRIPGGVSALLEGDTGWHIRTGDWIRLHEAIPRTDPFSFTHSGEPWFAWEWLWDVAFSWLHETGGWNAVVMATVVVLAVTFLLLYRLVRKSCGNAFVAIGVTLLAELLSSVHWLARPHMMTLLFVVVALYLLERLASGGWVWAMALVALTALWTNLHGGFMALFAMIGCLAVGEAIAATLNQRMEHLRRAAAYVALLACCAMASLLNPYAYQLHTHIVSYLSESYHARNIQEFLSLSFQHPLGKAFELYLLLVIPTIFWCFSTQRIPQGILLLFWLHQGLQSVRHIPILALVGAPLIASAVSQTFALLAEVGTGWIRNAARGFTQEGEQFAEMDRQARVPVLGISAIALFAWLLSLPEAPPRLQADFDETRYPKNAVAKLEPILEQRVFTHDEWGDYLIYRLYPRQKVFIDGRSDFYGPVFCQTYLDVWSVKHNWKEILERYEVTMTLLPTASALAGAMKEASDWRVVFDDGVAIAFQKRKAPHLRPLSPTYTDRDKETGGLHLAHIQQLTASPSPEPETANDHGSEAGPAIEEPYEKE